MCKMIRALQIGFVSLLAAGCAAHPPKQVTESLQARFPGAKVTSMDKEKENGKVVYDFELTQDGRKYETDIAIDGTILEIEKEVKVADLPAAISRAVTDKYPMSNIATAMEVNIVTGKEEKPDHYEIMVTTAARRSVEVTVGMDGTNLKESEEEKD